MQHDPKVCLEDALTACKLILVFTEGYDEMQYAADLKTKAAVERQFEIVGEALNRVRKIAPALLDAITDARQIIDFRNIITHGYDVIADRLVYETIQHDLPKLIDELESAIQT
jgi:uncharacterized protein with HEPN domain